MSTWILFLPSDRFYDLIGLPEMHWAWKLKGNEPIVLKLRKMVEVLVTLIGFGCNWSVAAVGFNGYCNLQTLPNCWPSSCTINDGSFTILHTQVARCKKLWFTPFNQLHSSKLTNEQKAKTNVMTNGNELAVAVADVGPHVSCKPLSSTLTCCQFPFPVAICIRTHSVNIESK